MKTLSLYICFLFAAMASHAQDQKVKYSIDGEIPGISSGNIYFSVFNRSAKRDSTQIKNGTFHFEGVLPEPSPVILSLDKNYVNKPLFMFFVDNGSHTLELDKDDLRNGIARGSATTADFEQFKQMEERFDQQFALIPEDAKDTSKAAQERLYKRRSEIFRNKKSAVKEFVGTHPASPVAAWAAHRFFAYSPSDAPVLAELFRLLSPSLHTLSYASEMKEIIDLNQRLAVGNMAPGFTQSDTSGTLISLSDFRGQYVLLDFWASWCRPCRAENPNVVKAYNKFKDKGFTILGVSLDKMGQREAWLNAIEKDGLAWTHVSDLKGYENEVAQQYGVKAIPTNFLIDPAGNIVAKNLRGDELIATLQRVFSN